MVSRQHFAVEDTVVCSGPALRYWASYFHWFRQGNPSLFKGVGIRPGSKYCHRHFTAFMLFFAPTKKYVRSWQWLRMSIWTGLFKSRDCCSTLHSLMENRGNERETRNSRREEKENFVSRVPAYQEREMLVTCDKRFSHLAYVFPPPPVHAPFSSFFLSLSLCSEKKKRRKKQVYICKDHSNEKTIPDSAAMDQISFNTLPKRYDKSKSDWTFETDILIRIQEGF